MWTHYVIDANRPPPHLIIRSGLVRNLFLSGHLFFETISNAYAYNVSPPPLIGVFGWFSDPTGSVPPVHLQRVIAFTSLLARRLILFKWKADSLNGA